LRAFALLFAAVAVLPGCRCIDPGELVGAHCDVPADCPSGQSCCADALCRADCSGVPGDGGADAGQTCGGVVCAANQKCVERTCVVRPCEEVTCREGERCANGGCLPQSCPGVTCAAGAVCYEAQCLSQACAFVVCPEGFACAQGNCVATSCGATPCDAGQVCQGSQCQDLSCSGLTCDGGVRCLHATCVSCAASEVACDDGVDDDCDGAMDCADGDCGGVACNDGDQCTAGERCQSGKCAGGTPSQCSAPPMCHQAGGACTQGVCDYPPSSNGSPCSDGNPCTVGDSCSSGTCQSGAVKQCMAPPGSCLQPVGVCATDGGCEFQKLPGGSPCDDGNACTKTDKCTSTGACVGTAVVCAAPGLCEKPGVCQSSTGTCAYAANTGAACTGNSNPCTKGVCASNKTCGNGTAQPDGTEWGGKAYQRCCGGSPKNISNDVDNCGGCGSACIATGGSGNICRPNNVDRGGGALTCGGTLESGRCECIGQGNCPHGQGCYDGASGIPGRLLCGPYTSVSQCAPKQRWVQVNACSGGGGPDYCAY